MGLELEHQPDTADGAGRRAHHVPLPRRLELGRLSFQRPTDLQRGGDRFEHGELHRVGRRRGTGHHRLRLGEPARGGSLPGIPERPVGNTTSIGVGQEWNDSTDTWQTVNWQTAGYWASLRAAAPLAHDDGLNFLRLDHPAPFNIQYWEVGNEEYGSWEIDHHTAQHDPATYIAFAKKFATYAAGIDPTISIGLDVGSPGRLQQLDRRHPPAVVPAGLHAGLPERSQLRTSSGQRERLQPLARHRHRPKQQQLCEASGHLELLVINKSATSALTGQFQLANFQPAAQAEVWQYGKAQDTAQSKTADGHSALANFTANLTVTGSIFNYQFPAYSMTVLSLGKAAG